MKTQLFALATLAALVAPVAAEYRVALIIGDGDMKPIATRLAKSDFLCEISPSLTEKELGRKIESWSSNTPTNSTALIYFQGEALNQEIDGTPTACLLSSNGRPFPLSRAFEILNERGGSRKNMIVAESKTTPEFVPPRPENNHFTYQKLSDALEEAEVTGRGSLAISPPESFMPGNKAGDEWVNARGMVFCWCPPGRYTAGSPKETPLRFPDEEPREVIIKDGFWIAKYEHTRGQKLRNLSNNSIGTDKSHPVERLHWDDGRAMLRNLTKEEREKGRLPLSWEYSLPDSDQWEYAARAGTSTLYHFGDDMKPLPEHANFADKRFYDSGDIYSNHAHRTLDDGFEKLAPVGSYKPNPWGLHDVYGNVAEWCRDHSARGGSWVSLGENCRSAYRDSYSSRNDQNYLGYRFVIQPNVPDPPKKE